MTKWRLARISSTVFTKTVYFTPLQVKTFLEFEIKWNNPKEYSTAETFKILKVSHVWSSSIDSQGTRLSKIFPQMDFSRLRKTLGYVKCCICFIPIVWIKSPPIWITKLIFLTNACNSKPSKPWSGCKFTCWQMHLSTHAGGFLALPLSYCLRGQIKQSNSVVCAYF